MTDRLESSVEAVGELSTHVRAAASRQATDVTERAVDELLERALAEELPALVAELEAEMAQTGSAGSLALAGLFVANLAAMTLGVSVSRERAPLIPDEIRGPNGETVVTDEQVRTETKAFQANGLMNQGPIPGNGSYFEVDLTADSLELKAEYAYEYYACQRESDSLESLPEGDRAAVERRVERELDADAPEGEIARRSAAEVCAHRQLREAYCLTD